MIRLNIVNKTTREIIEILKELRRKGHTEQGILQCLSIHSDFYVYHINQDYSLATKTRYKFRNDDDRWIYYFPSQSSVLINIRLNQVYEVYACDCFSKVIKKIKEGASI